MDENSDSSSTTESEVNAQSSKFNALKALYSKKVKIPANTPKYENLQQFEAALIYPNILPFGDKVAFRKRAEADLKKKQDEKRLVQEKNQQKSAQYRDLPPVRRERIQRNMPSRKRNMVVPLEVLKDWVDKRVRVRVVMRNESGGSSELHGTLVSFDKHWNLILSDVLESKIPVALDELFREGKFECIKYSTQVLIRGNYVVLISIIQH